MIFVIEGKTGKYTVRFDKINHHMYEMNLYAWSCTCPYYQKGRNLTCKHIKKAKMLCKLRELIEKAVPCVT